MSCKLSLWLGNAALGRTACSKVIYGAKVVPKVRLEVGKNTFSVLDHRFTMGCTKSIKHKLKIFQRQLHADLRGREL